MKIRRIVELLDAKVYCGEDMMDVDLHSACASDMMSDVLAFVKDQSVLLTGLVNPQVVRTADMMDIRCIIFVRGKRPDEDIIELAQEREIAVMCTGMRMFSACGLLWENGLRG